MRGNSNKKANASLKISGRQPLEILGDLLSKSIAMSFSPFFMLTRVETLLPTKLT